MPREISILFTGPNVRLIQADQKIQTRRTMKPQPTHVIGGPGVVDSHGKHVPRTPATDEVGSSRAIVCPYGQPGDTLWVRETYFAWGRWETRHSEKKGRDEWHFVDMTLECDRAYRYATEGDGLWPMPGRRQLAGATPSWWKRPAIFMPRAACRLTLAVTEVRFEQLQDISEADAQAEGCSLECMTPTGNDSGSAIYGPGGYLALWESINGAGSWAANPWVWVVSFRRLP